MTVEFITRRPLTCDGARVHRLLVTEQSGEQVTMLAAPGTGAAYGLETGQRYHIAGVLGADPVEQGELTDGCPVCGGQVRRGQTVDAVGPAVATAAVELGLDEPFGIVDENTTIRPIRDDKGVDDWQSMGQEEELNSPDYVCEECGRTFDSPDVHGHRERGQSVDENLLDRTHAAPTQACDASPETMGLAAGGAKDANNFRENVANGYTPQPEAISDEGLFYDYHFETGPGTETDALFAPRYAAATSDHPLTGDTEQYLSVGLDSSLSVEEFERPRLDLVVVLDVSGSMNSQFDAYYYDEHGRRREAEDGAETKLEAAIQSLCALTEQLRGDDRLGVVLYNHRAHVAKPLRDVATTDMPAIRRHIREIAADGGTNLEDGFEAAVDMLADGRSDGDVERRMVFMTDMMPNVGETGSGGLTDLFADAAVDGIHTTFVGMGLDENAALADALSGIRGANHYFVHSASEFERRLGDEFDYMVTPLVYDLDLSLEGNGFEIAAVHGSPSADAAADQLMHVGTLFPSSKEDGKARGGVVLVRLEPTGEASELELTASWTERDGGEYTSRVSVSIPDEKEAYPHSGVRKAIALSQYARELRSWAADVTQRADNAAGVDDWLLPNQRGDHERDSTPLVVPEQYVDRFAQMRDYLEAEMAAVGDETLAQEVSLLTTLIQQSPKTPREVTE